MTKFEIDITLVIDADEVDPDSIPAYDRDLSTKTRISQSRIFKCRECGTKYVESFCSSADVAICRWCSGEETEAGILE
mgnify:CR=1 FL=1